MRRGLSSIVLLALAFVGGCAKPSPNEARAPDAADDAASSGAAAGLSSSAKASDRRANATEADLLPDTTSVKSDTSPSVQIAFIEGRPVFEVTPSPEDFKALSQLDAAGLRETFKVFVPDLADPPPLDGKYELADLKLRFTPRFPLEPGVRYQTLSRLVDGAPATAHEFAIEKPPDVGATLLGIYPTAKVLPENQLKFYLHFSAPMSRGEAYRHIHLIAGDGTEVADPFLELGEELWDPTMTRFTLLCDPGRIKRGLKPREEVGPVLEEGKDYTLVVDSDWRDANGNPMASGGGRAIEVGPPDDKPVDPKTWQLEVPKAGSRDPLVVRFGESLDQAMLARVLAVKPLGGEKLSGKIEISDSETCWSFTPHKPWTAGAHQLVAATTLEDLAGNSIGRAFEVDEERPLEAQIITDTVAIDFQPQ